MDHAREAGLGVTIVPTAFLRGLTTSADAAEPVQSMNSKRLFVGRRDELERFDEVLAREDGEAIVVVGHQGMGKTMLVDQMADRARHASDLECGAVRYEVTKNDTVASTLALMIDHAFEAATVTESTFSGTARRREQWQSLLNVAKLGDLVQNLRRDPAKHTRDQFLDRLRMMSRKMPQTARALFVIDPEKYMAEGVQEDWRLVVKALPPKIKFLFAQRPEDVLAASEEFMALENVARIPGAKLDVLDEEAVEQLIEARKSDIGLPASEVREAIGRYDRHPYAVPAALDLLAQGTPTSDLAADPTTEGLALMQWRRVGERHGAEAKRLLEAYAVLDVGVPDEVVEAVSGLDPIQRRTLMDHPFLAGLLRSDGNGRRIYASLLSDHIRDHHPELEASTYHRRAIDVYRRRLTADTKPDALAAERLAEHARAIEGNEAFVAVFVEECFRPLTILGLLDTAEALSLRALQFLDSGSSYEGLILGNLGLIYRRRGDLDRAEEMHRKSLAIEEKLGRPEGMANQYGNLGLIYRTRGDLDRAEEMHRKSLAIEEKFGRLEGMAKQYGNLGAVFLTRGDFDRAENMLRKSLAIKEKIGRPEGMAVQYGNLGSVYLARGDLERAEEMLREALEIDGKFGRLEGMGNAHGNLGVVDRKRGNVDGARAHWTTALKLFRRIGMVREIEKVQRLLDELPPE